MSLLRAIFGPSKDEIWSQIAEEIGGEYIDGGFWGKGQLVYKHKEWEMVLDSFTRSHGKHRRSYTRMRVPFVNKDGLYFRVSREGLFSGVGKLFGMQDIQLGDNFFDDDFMIKGNDVLKIKAILSDHRLKELFSYQPQVNVFIKNDDGWFGQSYPDDVDVLYFECMGIIKEKEVLFNLFELFAAILNRLVHLDSAYAEDPNFRI